MSAASFVSNLPTLNSERGLSRYLAAINAFPLLNAEDEKKYSQRLTEQGDREAAYHSSPVTCGSLRKLRCAIEAMAFL